MHDAVAHSIPIKNDQHGYLSSTVYSHCNDSNFHVLYVIENKTSRCV